MACAAVVSLEHTLLKILFQEKIILSHRKEQISLLLTKVEEIQCLLAKSSQNSSEEVKLEIKIRDMAYLAEDVIEVWQIDLQKRSDSRMEEDVITEMDTIKDLHKVIREMDTIMQEMEKIKDGSGELNLVRNWDYLPSRPAPCGQTNMVGFAEDLKQIKDRLCNDQQSTRQTIPIVGMGGIGKTTLAMNVYNDPFIAYHFYICAWVTISQQYRIREILLSLLDDIGVLTDEIRKESDEQLKERIYKSLKGKRYLIVMDDVWSINAWNDIQMLFPDDNNGSRILLTTRLTDVADYASSTNHHHLMDFLAEEESWKLFRQKVLGEANFPPELETVGRKISKNCGGLPLLIVVIARLLAGEKPLDYWEYVAVNLSSIIAEKKDHCSEILTLSYNNLPPRLKPCFLYMGVFPENYEIPVSRLIKLWEAEGIANHPFEAERYLMDLIGRNLILVGQKGSVNGQIKTCRMHDLLRELCVRIAHEENFLYVKSRHLRSLPEEASFKRRLSIHDDASYSGREEDVTMQSMDLVRSFIYNGWDETQLHSYYYFGCRLLRVLDMVGVELSGFPEEILLLVNLRYIAISCHAVIPASITVLRNLHTLIVEDSTGIASQLPIEIWNMPQLRHLKFSRVILPAPPPNARNFFLLLNLETLSVLDSLDFDISQITPFLMKLGIHYNSQSSHSLNHFADLQNLQTLKILFDSPANSTFINIALPSSLKKITLERGRIGWENMKIFGSLPNLEVLKLLEYAFQGREWIPNKGGFLQLKFLLISETDLEHWRANDTHFPSLEHLILRNCSNLVEIPSDIGEIETLETIEIDNSSPSAVDSANKIQEDQRNQGNDGIKVFVHPTKTKVYPLKFGIQQDESGHFYRRKTKLDEFKIQFSRDLQTVSELDDDIGNRFVCPKIILRQAIILVSPANYTILTNLTKITLERVRIDWEYMRILGSLPNLEVLKLREYAFQGGEWMPNEGEFLQLKFLLIWETDLEHWRANNTHFPRLEHLILRNCSNLVEIPSDIGEIPTLETIEIDYSSPSAVDSAKKILEDQRSQGNEGLRVYFHPTKTSVYPLKFGIQQDESGCFYRRKTKLDEFNIQISRDLQTVSELDDDIGNRFVRPTIILRQAIIPVLRANYTILTNLTKITLERVRIDWECMRILGSLPNLEVLILLEYAFQGREWIPNEGEFLKLKLLEISGTNLKHFTANTIHFPRLEHLIIRNCSNLVEIPSDIGEIPTLETIE